MPKVVLTYFRMKALGECVRWLLAYGGQEFEDVRVTLDAAWDKLKPSTPFGQLPVLLIDGREYAQSVAIARYLGRKYGLAGADIEEDYLIDQVIDHAMDLKNKCVVSHYEKDPVLREKRHEDYTKNVYPALLKKLDDIIRENNGYVANGKLSWGDFVVAGMLDYLKEMLRRPQLEREYPGLQQVADRVLQAPQLAKYLAQPRPVDYTY